MIIPPSDGAVDDAVGRGWVDLRSENCSVWIARACRVVELAAQRHARPEGSGSELDWEAIEPDDPIEPSQFAAWIFRYEDAGERIKR